jgi:hypothetical protein
MPYPRSQPTMLIGHDSAGISQIKSREGIELLKDL